MNKTRVVVGLPEGDWLDVRDDGAKLCGPHAAVLFKANAEPIAIAPGRLRWDR
jgi:dipeptidase E